MTTELAVMEQVMMTGDLSKLSAAQRVEYYGRVCESVGLNPFTRPFDYITLNQKLTLYAKREAADQLRSIKGISIDKPDIAYVDNLIVVTVTAHDATGRTDSDVGVVVIGHLKDDARANAIMKAITKAKRRVTLSIAGLGWLDETEVETIPSARLVTVDQGTGEIVEQRALTVSPEPAPVSVAKPRTSDPEFKKRLAVLMADYEIEAIKRANNGDMPKTVQAVEDTIAYLNAQSVPMDDLVPLPY